MIDLSQKQDVFDEVIKIIEEEGLDVENLFLSAFEKLCQEAKEEFSESQSDSNHINKPLSTSNVKSSGITDSNFALEISEKSKSILPGLEEDGSKNALDTLHGQLKLDLNVLQKDVSLET